jgi:hypothetical protein
MRHFFFMLCVASFLLLVGFDFWPALTLRIGSNVKPIVAVTLVIICILLSLPIYCILKRWRII